MGRSGGSTASRLESGLALSKRPKSGRPIGFGSRGCFRVDWTLSGWVVKNDDGSGIVAGPFADREAATQARIALSGSLRPKTTLRACLCCTAQFASDGPHNRLCPTCANHGLPNQHVGT